MAKIISFFMSLLFALEMFFIGMTPEKQIVITQLSQTDAYCINGENEQLRFGVVGDGNLFAPDENIGVVVECLDKALDGTRMKVTVAGKQTGFNKRGYVVLSAAKPYNTFSFSSSANGIFTVKIELPGSSAASFNVGVVPSNEQAGDDFYYGIQPYVTRAYTWGEGFQVPYETAESAVDRILRTAQYLGVNLVREDSVGWAAMQSEANGEVNFTEQDYLVGKVNEYGMKYNWILGFNAGKWSAAEKYKENYDEAIGWTYPPEENLWADFAGKVAAHYADNTDILWEIWNEPNWPFFAGTPEEYFALLENTASVLKAANPSAYVFTGGLAVAERESNLAFYQKSAELMQQNLLDNFAYHNHDGLDKYYDNMKQMYSLIQSAGLTTGGINSESGVGGTDAATIACKALYTRSKGANGFVSFSFRKTPTPENDVNNFAFFDEYLQPTEVVITYATVIRFLGNARFVGNKKDEKNLVIDEYAANGKKIEVYYSLGDKTTVDAPAGTYTAYDMYGNQMQTGNRITVSNTPVYLVY